MTARTQLPKFFSKQVSHANRFYLDLTPAPDTALTVVCGGKESCASDYVIDREDFPYYSIEFVHRGKGKLTLDGNHVDLSGGTIYTYGPGVAHRIASDNADPLEKYFVDFTGTDALRLLEETELGPGIVRQIPFPLNAQRALDDLIQHGSRGGSSATKLCNALIRYFLLLVSTSATAAGESLSPAYTTYARCRDHIEENYLRLHSLDEIAKETFVDKTYLCRMFQRFDDQTPYQLLTRLKMNRAAELLEEPENMVKQVAASLGFANAFHFSRSFKSVFGMSPQAFRTLRSSST